jgi:hypothetical protein
MRAVPAPVYVDQVTGRGLESFDHAILAPKERFVSIPAEWRQGWQGSALAPSGNPVTHSVDIIAGASLAGRTLNRSLVDRQKQVTAPMALMREWAARIDRRNIAYVVFISLPVPLGMLMASRGSSR